MQTGSRILLALVMVMPLWPTQTASAETVYLKNGTVVKGRIVKEDDTSFAIETQDGRRKVAKSEVELLPAVDPNLALLSGLLFSGAGHVYADAWGRGAFFLGLSAIAGGAGYLVARQGFPNSTASQVLGAALGYGVGTVMGALDARALADAQSKLVRYRVSYDN